MWGTKNYKTRNEELNVQFTTRNATQKKSMAQLVVTQRNSVAQKLQQENILFDDRKLLELVGKMAME